MKVVSDFPRPVRIIENEWIPLRDGKRLWDRRVKPGPWLLKDLRGGYTAPTPASDGRRVYVVFGSAVIAALDFEGNEVWRKEIRPYESFDVAIGSSPGADVKLANPQILRHHALTLSSRGARPRRKPPTPGRP